MCPLVSVFLTMPNRILRRRIEDAVASLYGAGYCPGQSRMSDNRNCHGNSRFSSTHDVVRMWSSINAGVVLDKAVLLTANCGHQSSYRGMGDI